MRSLEARFANFYSSPGKSSYIAFADAVMGQGFSGQTIRRWFYKVVEPDDYEGVPTKELFWNLENISKGAEDNKK